MNYVSRDVIFPRMAPEALRMEGTRDSRTVVHAEHQARP
jgi:hypothetical protein